MKKHIWFSFLFLVLISGCGKEAQKQKVEVRTIKVQTATLQKQEFREIFRAQGMVEAARKGTISSFVPGKIDKIFFEEGAIAEAGKSLFQVDLTNLTNRVELAQKDLEVAKASRLSTQQGVELARIRLQKAERDFKRNQTLYSSKAVSADTYEQADTAYHSALVMLDVAVSLDRAAAAKVQQAETALKLARQMLDDSHPAVPFRALILTKFKEESEFAGPGMPVVAVEDPASREISCRISAIYWDRLDPGTVVDVCFGGKKICRSSVYFRAEVIDPASRTFEIKAKLPADTSLKSGTLCDLEIILTRRTGWGVTADAVLSGGKGRMSVFVNQNGTAKEIDVRCGLTTDGITEILSPEPLLGKAVIVRGQAFVREGDKLEVER
ncbi:MAG: efflux RND transporter periplasmic adaptor subunit [Lentisphaeria bacterium]|nr:efflux RND transporter periplasmic adaptor subunit [Lentisphaeria bacterium]